MLPSEVNSLKIRDAVEFDKQSNPVKYKEFTFFIGDHGPFTEKFYAGEQDTPAIERRINNDVAQLRELGAITQGTPSDQGS
jgi:hypothetical protein